ncbi:MAG: endopeptidase La [Desulfobacteraceae bacterium]|nr:MAG: endopeptidase La [Desulfobacteraceae bacterium]
MDLQHINFSDVFPVLPVKDAVLFPRMVVPLLLTEEAYVQLSKDVMQKERLLIITMLKEEPKAEGEKEPIYPIGTLARIVKRSRADEGILILVQGLTRIEITEVESDKPYRLANIRKLENITQSGKEVEALVSNLLSVFSELVHGSPYLPDELIHLVRNVDDSADLADIIAAHLNMDRLKKQTILEALDIKERLEKITLFLNEDLEVNKMGQAIQSQVKKGMDKSQRDYYLREQLKAIQNELGMEKEETGDIQDLKTKLAAKDLPEAVRKVADKELEKLSKMNPSASEYTVTSIYLGWLLDLPWSESTADLLDIPKAEEVLNRHHYGLEKVKKRILEYLAVRKLNPRHKGSILCLVGPPGTGKTSLGRSIAEAMGRKFVRISLGGVHDEAEIRGHRRTYVGALPGRIIHGLKKAGSNNPVFMLDEIDKIGSDFRGDPADALLEVLDPEQNFSFSDHYLETEFDLSKIMFITTANRLDTIPGPLQDRMEVLELAGYTEEEKARIAEQFLIPRQLQEHGLEAEKIKFSHPAIHKIISGYTREAGVRNLEREIGGICRGLARKIASGGRDIFTIKPGRIAEYRGVPHFSFDIAERTSVPGVATGMAWTPTGGDILFVEATMMPGQKSLVLTGQLGEVMKESAQAALSYLRSKAKTFGIAEDFYQDHDLHIHVPAGGIPKDGPSAGVTMLTALASLLTCRPIKSDFAMTGEVTLRGDVLPVGGIKEKVLAAKRSGIKHVILPERNRKDLEEIPANVRKGLSIHYVKKMEEVLNMALDGPIGPSCN